MDSSSLPEINVLNSNHNDEIIKSDQKSKINNQSYLPEINVYQRDSNNWIRCIDNDNHIYYYNQYKNESCWLAPCYSCYKPSNQWCLDCKVAYCSKDFKKFHFNNQDNDRSTHQWTFKEIPERITLQQPYEVYCIKCKLNIGRKLCMDCWDPYCVECFGIIHHNASLKHHKALPYQRAKMGWTLIKNYGIEPDYYYNGTTGIATKEKPTELMTEMEQVLLKNCETYMNASKAHTELIEKLRNQLLIVELERDNALIESGKILQEMRAKNKEKEVITNDNVVTKSSKGNGFNLFGISTSTKKT